VISTNRRVAATTRLDELQSDFVATTRQLAGITTTLAEITTTLAEITTELAEMTKSLDGTTAKVPGATDGLAPSRRSCAPRPGGLIVPLDCPIAARRAIGHSAPFARLRDRP
jgi:hypothetical protein